MSTLTDNQRFHLILGDIAMRMALATLGVGLAPLAEPYSPGEGRESGLAALGDETMRRRVLALANAGLAALQRLEPDRLAEQAGRFGVPLDAALAQAVSTHFINQRDAVLTYRR
jgi:hypothetical protein